MTIQTEYHTSARCPGCGARIFFYAKPKLGEFISCKECGDLVEVISLAPLTLDWSADIDEEDWSDSGDDDVEYIDDFDEMDTFDEEPEYD